MVKVKGAKGSKIENLSELGLANERGVKIIPRFVHQDIHTDDFGTDAPADVLWNLAEVVITMMLIHYDNSILLECLKESMGGGTEGTFVDAGMPMGGTNQIFDKNCHFISLNLLTSANPQPWHFPSTYLTGPPIEQPIGTEKSLVSLKWRAIPYFTNFSSIKSAVRDVNSAGTILWDHTLDK